MLRFCGSNWIGIQCEQPATVVQIFSTGLSGSSAFDE
jgi:hypothetical protein